MSRLINESDVLSHNISHNVHEIIGDKADYKKSQIIHNNKMKEVWSKTKCSNFWIIYKSTKLFVYGDLN